MRHLSLLATGVFLIAAAGSALAAPIAPGGLARADGAAPVVLVQGKKKSETVTQKVKRAWRRLTGYTFEVTCPIDRRTTCSETGDSRAAARNKCIARHPFCWVAETR
jgi:hypothetical protein